MHSNGQANYFAYHTQLLHRSHERNQSFEVFEWGKIFGVIYSASNSIPTGWAVRATDTIFMEFFACFQQAIKSELHCSVVSANTDLAKF